LWVVCRKGEGVGAGVHACTRAQNTERGRGKGDSVCLAHLELAWWVCDHGVDIKVFHGVTKETQPRLAGSYSVSCRHVKHPHVSNESHVEWGLNSTQLTEVI
jgi:hypothetical protein